MSGVLMMCNSCIHRKVCKDHDNFDYLITFIDDFIEDKKLSAINEGLICQNFLKEEEF